MKVSVRACDACARIEGVVEISKYELRRDGTVMAAGDLCDDDARGLIDATEGLARIMSGRKKRRTFEDDMVDPQE